MEPQSAAEHEIQGIGGTPADFKASPLFEHQGFGVLGDQVYPSRRKTVSEEIAADYGFPAAEYPTAAFQEFRAEAPSVQFPGDGQHRGGIPAPAGPARGFPQGFGFSDQGSGTIPQFQASSVRLVRLIIGEAAGDPEGRLDAAGKKQAEGITAARIRWRGPRGQDFGCECEDFRALFTGVAQGREFQGPEYRVPEGIGAGRNDNIVITEINRDTEGAIRFGDFPLGMAENQLP